MNKWVSIILVALLCISSATCQREKPITEKNGAGGTVSETQAQFPVEEKVSAEIQKLHRVFASLSQRTRDGIVNGDSQEFLADLQQVLAEDADNLLTLVDKQHYLAADFVPADIVALKANDFYLLNRNDLSLRVPVEKSLREMGLAAKADGINLVVSSTYRSYDYQKNLYERNVRQLGKEVADRESAPPGASQHQLGVAVDFGSITDDFAQTKQGRWLASNAGKYGWSLSFPDGYEDVTGYRWECWHYRYIGVTAVEFQKKWFSDVQQFMLEFIHAWKTVQ